MRFVILFTRFAPVVILAMLAATPAVAQTETSATQIAKECVEAMRNHTMRTSDAMHDAAEETVRRIRMMAADGVPDREIYAFANESKRHIRSLAQAGRERLRTASSHCLRRLRDAGASRDLIEAVIDARNLLLTRVNQSERHAIDAIDDALRQFLR